MEKTMKVTIGGKTTVISDQACQEAIMEILIFGVVADSENKAVPVSAIRTRGIGKKKKRGRKKKVVRREIIRWDSSEIEKLKKLALDGVAVSEIARIFGKRYYRIDNKLRSLGLQKQCRAIRKIQSYQKNSE